MKSYHIILALFLLLFSLNVSAGLSNNQSCTLNSDCNSEFCAQGYCCNINQCGYNNACYNLNATYNSPGSMGGVDHVCTQAGWKLAKTENCANDSDCVTNKCTNHFCCNANQCGAAYMSPGFCTDVGENVSFGPNSLYSCVSEGLWKKGNNNKCNESSECVSDNCLNGICCNTNQCSYNSACYNLNDSYVIPDIYGGKSNVCTTSGWRLGNTAPCENNTQCVSNKCTNNYCCNANQCGGAYMSPGFCTNVSDYYCEGQFGCRKCVSEGIFKIMENSTCTNNSDCISNNCAQNVCCAANQCGYNHACYNLNATYNIPGAFGGVDHVCTPNGWKLAEAENCGADSECGSGKCINHYCCNTNQCGALSYMGPGYCYNIGENLSTPSTLSTCVSEGIWKQGINQTCSANSECASNNCINNKCVALNYEYHHTCNSLFECSSGYCNGGYCCNTGECGTYYRCVADGVTTGEGSGPAHTCRNGTWRSPWGTGCGNGCDTGTTCIGGFCCYSGQCGYGVNLGGNCFNVGDVVHDTMTCTDGGIWKTKYGSACSNNSECFTGNCNNGMCCNAGECGNERGCSKEGEGPPYSNPGTQVCHNGAWMAKFGAGCGSTSDCSAGVCINNFCCNPGQCGYSSDATHNCYDIGQQRNLNICVAQGTWKLINRQACTNSSDCASANCNNGFCCNSGECGRNSQCYASGNISSSEICRSGIWSRQYGWACDQYSCDNTSCINGFCCMSGQCGYSTDQSNNCYAQGVWHNNLRCVSQGNWAYGTTTSTTTTSTTTTLYNQSGGIQVQTFKDLDGDGAYDANELGIAGITFNVVGPQSFTLVTGSNGAATLEHLPFGNYTITEVMPPGYTNTTPTTVNADVSYWAIFVFSFGHKPITTTTTTTTTTTSTTLPCSNLWWFDNTTRACSLKQFCGDYMYYGLRTFQNQSDCLKELTGADCVSEGNYSIVYPGAAKCCAGLTPINPTGVYENGSCGLPSSGSSICTQCGNGVCGIGENKCNCPADCSCNEGITIDAYWDGARDKLPTMVLLVDDKIKALWNVVAMDKEYEYPMQFECGNHEIGIAYFNSTQPAEGTLHIYSVKADCNEYKGKDLTQPKLLAYELNKTSCLKDETCLIPGDTPECGTITLSEITDYLNKWENHEANIKDVINLIRLWAGPIQQ